MANFPKPSSLTLGTAAFGAPYGIGNPAHTPSPKAVEEMLDQAWDAGITAFDTAPAYGEAEARLGNWIKRRGRTPHIATKLPSLVGVPDTAVADAVKQAIQGSCTRLGLRPATYLTHGAADYLRPAVRACLQEAAEREDVGAIGVSLYTAADVFAAITAGPPNAIQLPISVLDPHMTNGGALASCTTAAVTVFARSVFLQGVILMPLDRIPPGLDGLRSPLMEFDALCTEAETTRASVSLRYVRDLPGVSSTIVGAYASDQIAALIAAAKEPPISDPQRAAIASIAKSAPAELLDPRTWPSKG